MSCRRARRRELLCERRRGAYDEYGHVSVPGWERKKGAGARKFGHSTWWRSETRCPSRLGLDRAIELVIRLLLHVRWIWDSELARLAAVLPAPLATLPVRVPRLRTCSQTDSSLAWRPPSVTALAVGHKKMLDVMFCTKLKALGAIGP